jgi:hypothetical protein
MSDYSGLGDLVDQIKDASASIAQSDTAFNTRLNGFEKSLNELYLKTCRPGFDGGHDNASFERKEAIDFCKSRHAITVNKVEEAEYDQTIGAGSPRWRSQRRVAPGSQGLK